MSVEVNFDDWRLERLKSRAGKTVADIIFESVQKIKTVEDFLQKHSLSLENTSWYCNPDAIWTNKNTQLQIAEFPHNILAIHKNFAISEYFEGTVEEYIYEYMNRN